MPFAVDEEAVPADSFAGRPGLDPGQVDAADGELAENVHQRARMIVGQEGDDRGPIADGGLGQRSWPAKFGEPGHRSGPVMNAGDQYLKLIMGSREAAGQRRIEFAIGDLPGGVGVRQRRPPLGVGQVVSEPATALRLGHRVTADHLDVGQRGAGPD